MQIHGPSSIQPSQVHGPQPLGGPHAQEPLAAPSGTTLGGDEVQISAEADLVARVHDLPEVRQQKIDAIRVSIESGEYETAEKIDVALERLLDELA